MEEFSQTLCNEQKLLTAIKNVYHERSEKNWKELLAAADMINQLAIDELSQLKAEIAEIASSMMKITHPLNTEGEELAMKQQCDLSYEIQEKTQLFIDINDIRISAQQEAERARQALESANS